MGGSEGRIARGREGERESAQEGGTEGDDSSLTREPFLRSRLQAGHGAGKPTKMMVRGSGTERCWVV